MQPIAPSAIVMQTPSQKTLGSETEHAILLPSSAHDVTEKILRRRADTIEDPPHVSIDTPMEPHTSAPIVDDRQLSQVVPDSLAHAGRTELDQAERKEEEEGLETPGDSIQKNEAVQSQKSIGTASPFTQPTTTNEVLLGSPISSLSQAKILTSLFKDEAESSVVTQPIASPNKTQNSNHTQPVGVDPNNSQVN
ncbi:uncharacterized protein I206_104845 [Kwoniella pini CBS 10737]|uniref:Uncharacterized protein n=1 Tax=Kwoniella pini CBS 10737 TaxID=1296096 RepID=A0A1B9I7Y5_9TREE|nr:uncharacterized protein I206_02385 [Kwoniella pini CBS 10737]OCF51670.1 hypothetical protein I206_02385 [Kwoniella pini CBS 10737]